MIAIEKRQSVRHVVPVPVTEWICAALQIQRHQNGSMRDRAKRQDRRPLAQRRELERKVTVARADFHWQRTILRRQTLHCVSNPAVNEAESVVGIVRYRARGKTVLMQRFIKKLPCEVAGKRATCTIRAVLARREPNDQQPSSHRSKRRHGSRMVSRKLFADRIEMASKPRAAAARLGETRQGARHLG